MDRTRPRYRLFDLRDEADGRDKVWFVVEVDFSPGQEVSPAVSARLFEYVEASGWSDLFWEAYTKNRKATLYEPMPDMGS